MFRKYPSRILFYEIISLKKKHNDYENIIRTVKTLKKAKI